MATLIYFASRGRAEIIRLVAAEAGVEWDERAVVKQDLAAIAPFAQVPVWEEPGFRLGQSLAIVRYLAGGHGLMGKSLRETAQVDQMLGAFDDVRAEIRRLVTVEPERRTALRGELDEKFLPRWLGYFDRLLAANHDGTGFLVGDGPTAADLALWYLLELIRDNGFQALGKQPRLAAYAERIAARPRVAAYLASPKRFPFLPLPI